MHPDTGPVSRRHYVRHGLPTAKEIVQKHGVSSEFESAEWDCVAAGICKSACQAADAISVDGRRVSARNVPWRPNNALAGRHKGARKTSQGQLIGILL